MKWLNVMRTVAIIAVLIIHILANDLYLKINHSWWLANILDSIVRPAVPLFLMISGALLLHKDEPLKQYFTKRINKILLPFIFWTLIYYLYKTQGHFQLKELIKEGLSAQTYYHLWYFYILIPLYLLIPLLRKVIKAAPTSYLLFYAFISGLLVTVQSILPLFHTGLTIYSNPFSSGVSYLVLGYVLTHRKIEFRQLKWIGLMGLLIVLFGTYGLSNHLGKFNGVFYDALGLPVMVYASALFVGIKNLVFKHEALGNNKFIYFISANSFGIYLVHPLLLEQLKPYINTIKNGHLSNHILVYTLTLFVLLFCSSVIIFLLKKVPLFKRVV